MWINIFRLSSVCLLFCFLVNAAKVTYQGKVYIAEGSEFNITCIRSAYGSPKWYKNGLIIDPVTSEFKITEENVSLSHVRMGLSVEKALWKHRGHYKCDSLSGVFHKIEIVPTKETDQMLQIVERGRQKKVKLEPGKTLQLLCNKEEHDAFPINWYKDGQRIQAKEDEIQMEGRILRLLKTNISDTGDYVCIFEEKGQSYLYADHQGSRTWVTYGAHVVERFPHQIRPILSRNLSLECKVQGFPAPRIAWFVDGIDINSYMQNESRYSVLENEHGLPNTLFFISNVTYEDNHTITCVADNMDGSEKATTRLAVRENDIFTNEVSPGSGLTLTPGVELTISCNYSDSPLAVFQWFKDGLPVNVTSGSRFHLEPPTYNILKISKPVESDCGNYSCLSSNVRAVIPVRSIVKIAPLDNSRNVVQGQSIVLVCNVTQGTPLPTLLWYKDDAELNISDPRITIKTDGRGIEGSELTITDANYDDRAEYTCNAINDISSANITILVRVKDKYAALWPFLGICAEVAVLCTIIFIYEKRRQKPDFDESETEHNTENKNIPDNEDKSRDVRQRK